jgi:hypothetical protein
MMLANEDVLDDETLGMTFPFWFCRALKICHVMAKLRGDDSWTRINFIWARLFEIDNDTDKGSWSDKRLPGVSFIPATQDNAFGFIDPDSVIRSVHLIPNFSCGMTEYYLRGHTIARQSIKDNDQNSEWEDWEQFYLNMYIILFFFI